MKKEIYVCDICGKELQSDDVLCVILPRIVRYKNHPGMLQTAIHHQEICWGCCKKVAKLIDDNLVDNNSVEK